jgi:hypothetical protein
VTSFAGHLRSIPASATPEEAAAIVAAIERFMRASAPAGGAEGPEAPGRWQATALLEGVERDPPANRWINT